MKTTKEMREIAEKSTRVVAWYAHGPYESPSPAYASVRGPFNRHLLVTPVADRYKHEVASQRDDAEFAAEAMNNFVPLLDRIDTLETLLSEAMALLERAKDHVEFLMVSAIVSKEFGTANEQREWLSDLEKFTNCKNKGEIK